MHQKLFFLFLLAASFGCKKNVDYPPEIRPNEFWARYNITDENGIEKSYAFRGEDTTKLVNLFEYVVSIEYFSYYRMLDSMKQIESGLSGILIGTPFSIRLKRPELVTDPFTPPEWTASELEDLLYPGKTFVFGDGLGEAKISIQDYPNQAWSCSSNAMSNQGGYLRVLEVEDYGAPEIGVPYFGKKVKLGFAGDFISNLGTKWRLHKGEAVLFFRYFQF